MDKELTEIEVEEFVGKKIRVNCVDGDIIEGLCYDFTKALDNTPEVAEIGMKTERYKNGITGITLPEIKSIEVIE